MIECHDYAMIVSHSKSFIFFKPMKVAGSSIEAYLLNFCGEDDILTGSDIEGERENFGYVDRNNTDSRGSPIFHMHTPPCMLYTLTDIDKESFFKLSVVRNPWDTVVSYFWWCFYSPTSSLMSSCNDPSSESAQQFAEISPQADDNTDVLREKFTIFVDSIGHFNAGPRGDEGFHRVLDWLSRTNLEFTTGMDKVLRYERLQNDFDEACDLIKIEHGILPRLKFKQRKSPVHYSEYYDDYSILQVKIAFRDIIAKFGYDF